VPPIPAALPRYFFACKNKVALVGQWCMQAQTQRFHQAKGSRGRRSFGGAVWWRAADQDHARTVRRLACPWGCLLGGKPPVVAGKCSVLAWSGWSGVAWHAVKTGCVLAGVLLVGRAGGGGTVLLFQPLCCCAGLLRLSISAWRWSSRYRVNVACWARHYLATRVDAA
jgi:hypothetical protein